jgi:hypothetical protein
MVEWVYERAIVENVIPLYPSYWPTQFNDLPQKNTCNCWVYGDYLVGGAITILKNMSSSMGRIPYMKWKIKNN